MKQKLLLSCLVCLMVCLFSLAGVAEASEKLVDEPATLHFVAQKDPAHGDFDDMAFVKKYEERTGVHIDWELIPSEGFEEKKNLLLASGTLPDGFFNKCLNDYDVLVYGSQGYLLPLEDLIEEHCPNIKALFEKRPQAKAASTMPDGHIYTLPYIEEMGIIQVQSIFYVNQTWLNNLKLEIPNTWDEYVNVLRAFRDQDANGNGDPNDEIPYTGIYSSEGQGIFNLFGAFGRPDNPDHIVVEDGKAVFTADKAEYKQAVEAFHQLYKEGLIDPEFFTQSFSQMVSKGQSETNIIGSMIVWRDFQVVGTQRAAEDFVAIEPLINVNGERIWGRANNSEIRKHIFALTKDCSDPVLAMKWVDGLYEPMTSIELNWGTLDELQVKNEKGLYVADYTPFTTDGLTANEVRLHNTPGNACGGSPCAILEDAYGTLIEMETGGAGRKKILEEKYNAYVYPESYPVINYTTEQQEAINSFVNEINVYVNDLTAKWIVEGGIEQEWDAYVKQLNDMGLEEYMTIRQEALDTYLSAMN